MLGYAPKLDPQGNVMPTFNTDDWSYVKGYVTYADLLEYANRYMVNVFFATQQFTSILFNVSINDVTPVIFSYLKNVTSDIQSQFQVLYNKTTNQTYSSSTNRTTFSGTLASPVILLNNVNLNTRITTTETNVSALQTKTTAQSYASATNTTTISGTFSTPAILLNGTNLNTRLTNNETITTANTTEINILKPKVSAAEIAIVTLTSEVNDIKPRLTTAETNVTGLQGDVTIINSTLTLKANDSQVVHISGDETVQGKKTFTSPPFINTLEIATKNDVSTAINNLLGGAGSSYDTLIEIQNILQGNAGSINTILSNMVTITGTQIISGLKTFSSQLTASSFSVSGNTTIGTNNANTLTVNAASSFQNPITFTSTLNSISASTFAFLSGVTSNIQTQFNTLFTRLTNYNYDTLTATQKLTTKTAIEDTLATNTVISNSSVNNNITSNTILASNIVCSQFKCMNLYDSLPIPVIYITNQGVQYPIMKSGLFVNLTGINISQPLYITIAPNYQLVFYDATNLALARIFNPTTDFLYNIGISFTDPQPVSYQISLM